jgi:uncharacterized membrane protein YccC
VIARLRVFFSRQTPALRSAFATTLACEIALAIVMTLHLPTPAWALITVFALSAPTAGSSIQKAALRIVGTIVGAGLSVALVQWFDQAPLPFSLALFAVCAVASYGASGGRYPYMYLIGLITTLIIAMETLARPDRTVYVAFARAAEVGVGVAASVLVRLSVWPVRASAKLRGELATTLELGGPVLRGETRDDRGAAVVALIASRQLQRTLLETAGGEGDLTRAQEQRYGHAVTAVNALTRHVLAADAIAGAAGSAELAALRAALAQVMGDLGAALRRERGRGGAALASRLEVLRAEAERWAVDAPSAQAAALAQVLSALGVELRALAGLVDYLGPGGGDAPAEVDAAAVAAGPPPRRFHLDRARLLHAFKMALVGQTALWLWMVYHLPGGAQGMVSAMFIAQHSVGATLLKGRLRLLGALCGGTLGILVASFAIPGVSSLGVFCLLTAPVLFASAWLNDGSPRYGYLGFQTGFAFILTLVAGSSPEPDTLAPVLRASGVLIGIVAASVVLYLVAPVDGWREALRGLGAILTSIARTLRGGAVAAGVTERVELRDQTMAYMAELQPGAVRRGWPRWSLTELLALESRLGALIGGVGGGVPATPELGAAAAQLAALAERLGADVAARRPARRGAEVAAARSAAERALQSSTGAPASPTVLVQGQVLLTAADLLAAIEAVVAAADPAPARAHVRPAFA